MTAGPATTVINVSGGQFLPNQQTTLYWDQASKVAGSATADASGSFNTRVKTFAGDGPGAHKLCASVPPSPCAIFTLDAPQTSPSPSPSPIESPSPTAEPTIAFTPTASPVAKTLNGIDVITSPPFVFLPITGGLAIALSLFYWLFSVLRRPRPQRMPAAAVVHRATRPDYSAGFGTAPVGEPRQPDASAWEDSMRRVWPAPPATPEEAVAPSEPEPAPAVEEPAYAAPVEWGPGKGDWGYPEPTPPDDSHEMPKPSD
ncbi:MAG: hypothetical protein E6H99_04455 [Chloroflexi bacterium]|nr:MAG: hypothetical protein E6H99_04455 [Chloroflexota bacterium]